jgi:SPP1 family predicted phage head-tail adaptor
VSIRSLIKRGPVVEVYTVTTGQDSGGGPVPVESLQFTAHAFRQTLSGNETLMGGTEGTIVTHRFFFRKNVTLYESDVIKYGGDTYDIQFIDNPEAFTHHFEVLTHRRRS